MSKTESHKSKILVRKVAGIVFMQWCPITEEKQAYKHMNSNIKRTLSEKGLSRFYF